MIGGFNMPHLKTIFHRSLPSLEQYLLDRQVQIEIWFRQQFQSISPPFYASVDLRNSEFKIAPVDTNLFPGGFNNLNPTFLSLAVQACQTVIEEYFPKSTKILLIPESHTRNPPYFDNVSTLQEIILKAGFDVRIGSLIHDLKEEKLLTLGNGKEILFEPIHRVGNRLMLKDFDPDLIILNNDLSGKVPDILQQIEQPIFPPLDMGWGTRTKSNHFAHYADVSREFSEFIAIDPWLITPLFRQCSSVDFMERKGEVCLVEETQTLLSEIALKYRQYEIEKKPFVTIKADAGTYGIGVIMVEDSSDLKNLNRKMRKEMAVTKGGGKLDRVIIQEGIYTNETWSEQAFAAEPIVYMIGRYVIGGFYRIHLTRGDNQNLNAPGMQIIPLNFTHGCNNPDYQMPGRECSNRFYAYGVVARLALLAAARETNIALGKK